MVNNFDEKLVAFSSNKLRPWKLSVNRNKTLRVAKTCYVVHFDLSKKNIHNNHVQLVIYNLNIYSEYTNFHIRPVYNAL